MKTAAAAAAKYHQRGWKPVPINRKSKKPIGNHWQNKPYSRDSSMATAKTSEFSLVLSVGDSSTLIWTR